MATSKKEVAVLEDGRKISYTSPSIGDCATKEVYLSADRREVVCLYKDSDLGRDFEWQSRLRSVISEYNPTAAPPGATAGAEAAYYREVFRWPTAVVRSPRFGFVAPAIEPGFVFHSGPTPLRGKPKSMTWFLMPRARRLIAQQAPKLLGDLRGDLSACRALARAVMRLNQAGLAHADLSPNNILTDPASGKVCLIDLDGLAVPGRFSSPVLGTPGYIPPDVLARLSPYPRAGAIGANAVHGDQHALAVLIYQILLHRHPLDGRRVPAADTAEEQEHLSYGRDALFCEHPFDPRNRPEEEGHVPCTALGPDVSGLFCRAFVDGLHASETRPTAMEWLAALVKAGDMLRPCVGPACPRRWFVVPGPGRPNCPFCGAAAAGPAVTLSLLDEVRGRRWEARRLVLHAGLTLHRWHVEAGVNQGPTVDATPRALVKPYNGQLRLVNLGPGEMKRHDGSEIRVGSSVTLKDGMELSLSGGPRGRLARVVFL